MAVVLSVAVNPKDQIVCARLQDATQLHTHGGRFTVEVDDLVAVVEEVDQYIVVIVLISEQACPLVVVYRIARRLSSAIEVQGFPLISLSARSRT